MHRPTLFVAVLLTAFAPTLSADTIRVPKDAATLQAAVDLAGDGDEILVSSGRYTGNVLVQGFDGLRIGDFRSAFFSLADMQPNGKPLKVQPFSVTYTKVDGFPVSRRSMDKVAWYGDMDLAPHLVDYLKGGPYECTLTFFEPVTMEAVGNRKALARLCRDQIVQGNSDALSGMRGTPRRT